MSENLFSMRHIGVAIALFSSSFLPSAQAGTITAATGFAGSPGLGTVSVPIFFTLNPANDNQTGGGAADNNIAVPFKVFDNNGYIDIEFTVTPDNGVTEYRVTESVDNNTGTLWSSYDMILGYGVGAAFVPATAGDGLDFDFNTFDTAPNSTAFTSVANGEKTLVYSGGVQGSGAQTYQFRIDVPNIQGAGGLGRFTLRQLPTQVPEPGTIALAGMALAGLALGRLRK